MTHNVIFLLDADIRVDCNFKSHIVGKVHKGDVVSYIDSINGWFQLEDFCWVYAKDENAVIACNTSKEATKIKVDRDFIYSLQLFAEDKPADDTTKDKDKDSTTTDDKKKEPTEAEKAKEAAAKLAAETTAYANDIATAISEIAGGDTEVHNGDLRINNLFGIFGMPYQYLPTQDRRIDTSDSLTALGRKYSDKIAARLPLLVMVPGTPNFLGSYSSGESKTIMQTAIEGVVGSGSDVDDLLSKPGKYYELKPNWADYFNYVDAMCGAAAIFMGVGDEQINGQALSSLGQGYSWANFANSSIQSKLNYKGGVAFYVNSESQISESFSNATTQSQLAEKINSISDLGREMQFLLGSNENTTVGKVADHLKTDPTKDESVMNKGLSKLASGNTLVGTISHSFDTVIAGGKLIFPEIWADSQFSRDYSIDIKLMSPDNDDFSVYMNIVVPLLHLLGFVMPRGTGPSAFVSPFLIRGSYKGMFNIDMGIITNMNITKGEEGGWNHFGMPTTVDVNFTIKELYGVMALANNNSSNYKLSNNSILMDYIGNLCGVNINEPDIVRTLVYYTMTNSQRMDSYGKRIWSSMDQTITNSMQKLFEVH